jgi:carbon storage regulator CsrA
MLVLTRKPEEKIVIGKDQDQIVITVLRIQGDGSNGKVSLGIQAPRHTSIFRHELLLKEMRQNSKECGEEGNQVNLTNEEEENAPAYTR